MHPCKYLVWFPDNQLHKSVCERLRYYFWVHIPTQGDMSYMHCTCAVLLSKATIALIRFHNQGNALIYTGYILGNEVVKVLDCGLP